MQSCISLVSRALLLAKSLSTLSSTNAWRLGTRLGVRQMTPQPLWGCGGHPPIAGAYLPSPSPRSTGYSWRQEWLQVKFGHQVHIFLSALSCPLRLVRILSLSLQQKIFQYPSTSFRVAQTADGSFSWWEGSVDGRLVGTSGNLHRPGFLRDTSEVRVRFINWSGMLSSIASTGWPQCHMELQLLLQDFFILS